MKKRLLLILTVLGIIGVIWVIESRTKPIVTQGDIPALSAMPEKEGTFARAKEFTTPSGWVNTEPFTLASLIGKKVILLDFWTYSCINCQRTLPYLKDWYTKYKSKGLVIIGVHTPEFEFEKDIGNVRKAVSALGVQYPVVLDNDRGTWQAYGNQYWPREYLIDTDGYIVHDHIGEGGYVETEKAIQDALEEHMTRVGMQGDPHVSIRPPSGAPVVDFSRITTPEIYLGSERNQQYLGNGKPGQDGTQELVIAPADTVYPNAVYLQGTWSFTPEYVQCVRGCRLRLKYTAKQVNLVAGADTPASVTVRRDGVQWGTTVVSGKTLYTIIEDTAYGEHTLELEIPAGLQVFTLTFG